MTLERLEGRAREIGARRAKLLRGRVAEAIRSAAPGAAVTIAGDEVRVAGRGLMPALRWIGSLLR